MTNDEMTGLEYCGRGICAAMEDHPGTCAEASGWDAIDPGPATPLTEKEAE